MQSFLWRKFLPHLFVKRCALWDMGQRLQFRTASWNILVKFFNYFVVCFGVGVDGRDNVFCDVNSSTETYTLFKYLYGRIAAIRLSSCQPAGWLSSFTLFVCQSIHLSVCLSICWFVRPFGSPIVRVSSVRLFSCTLLRFVCVFFVGFFLRQIKHERFRNVLSYYNSRWVCSTTIIQVDFTIC